MLHEYLLNEEKSQKIKHSGDLLNRYALNVCMCVYINTLAFDPHGNPSTGLGRALVSCPKSRGNDSKERL